MKPHTTSPARQPGSIPSFPIRLLTVALVLTCLFGGMAAWVALDARSTDRIQRGHLRLEELRGRIVHLDEALTMSARMAAATGALGWEARYCKFEPQLDAAIKEAIKEANALQAAAADHGASETDTANQALVEMENRAFGLVRAGDLGEAGAILASPEYEAQKQIYARDIERKTSRSRDDLNAQLAFQASKARWLSIGAAALVVLTVWVWVGVVRGLRRWREALLKAIAERKQAEAELRQLNEQLEQRVRERTAQIDAANVELTGEIAERQRAETALQAERAQLARRVAERTADLSAANGELTRATRLKSEFLANMSHELRTPLNAVLGLSESLLEQCPDPLTARQVRAVTTIESSGRHLLSLINDILDVSKIEAGKLALEAEAVDVRAACEASLQLVRQQAVGKRLDLRFTCEMEPRPLHADPRRLKQILVNLLSNAVKFTPEGGKIGLEVHGDTSAGRLTLTVSDTGIGIAPEDQQRLFQPFVQVESALSRAYEGTGLGLVLVQRLAELHGGSVKLESEPGRGSRVSVSLPWNHAHPASGSCLPVHTEPISGVRSALIIEDAPTASEQLERYLAEMQVRSVVHEHAEGAVERAAELQPDVILLDILLPNASGWEVLRQLKEDERTRQIPVVVISVVDERGSPQAASAAGYLVKPISRGQFQAVLGHPKPLAAPAALTAPSILLAEDNEANIQTIGDYLLDHGFRVLVARNGVEAIEQVRAEQPALVLMDIQMPVMDGLEAIRHIRTDPALARVPIIALTALAMTGDRERCLAAGADDYLSKPVSLRELAGLIRQILHLSDPT